MTKQKLLKIVEKELMVIDKQSNSAEDLIFKLAGLYGTVLKKYINNN